MSRFKIILIHSDVYETLDPKKTLFGHLNYFLYFLLNFVSRPGNILDSSRNDYFPHTLWI